MATGDKPTWRLATAAEAAMMASEADPIGIMVERDPGTGCVVFIFAVETVDKLRLGDMEPDDFIAIAIADGVVDDLPIVH
jgi:hypothetical protein